MSALGRRRHAAAASLKLPCWGTAPAEIATRHACKWRCRFSNKGKLIRVPLLPILNGASPLIGGQWEKVR